MLWLGPFTEREIRTAVNTTARLIETAPTKVPPPDSSRLPESSKEAEKTRTTMPPYSPRGSWTFMSAVLGVIAIPRMTPPPLAELAMV